MDMALELLGDRDSESEKGGETGSEDAKGDTCSENDQSSSAPSSTNSKDMAFLDDVERQEGFQRGLAADVGRHPALAARNSHRKDSRRT